MEQLVSALMLGSLAFTVSRPYHAFVTLLTVVLFASFILHSALELA